MLLGLVGKPNAGKTTLFNALTHGHGQVASYPFTTILPNKGLAFATTQCACKKLGTTCQPRVGSCVEGVRSVPVNVQDVAGLVPGASEGKGKGNQFLNDLVAADALILVADASGSTDEQGLPAQGYDPSRDVEFIEAELVLWLRGLLEKGLAKAKGKSFGELVQHLSGVKVSESAFRKSVSSLALPENFSLWSKEQTDRLARELLKNSKPYLVAANKMDAPPAKANYQEMKQKFPDKIVVPVAADYELALSYASQKGLVSYNGAKIEKSPSIDPKAGAAIDKISAFVTEWQGTGTQRLVNECVFNLLGCIVVFPVEDETHYADHNGRVLPDAVLLPPGSTALSLAERIHTDLAKGFLYAVDAKKKMRIGAESKLENGAVIKIVSSR